MQTFPSITKTYSNLKAAHAQWRHPGHCKRAHGENWTIHVTFEATKLDECGFVVDFGGLRGLRALLEDVFDHTLLLDKDDPDKDTFNKLTEIGRAKIHYLPSASAEGLCKFVFELADGFVKNLTDNRVWVSKVIVEEDSKNIATLTND